MVVEAIMVISLPQCREGAVMDKCEKYPKTSPAYATEVIDTEKKQIDLKFNLWHL